MYICKLLFLLVPFLITFSSVAAKKKENCRSVFPYSRLDYENKALKDVSDGKQIHPKFVDIGTERALQKSWNEQPKSPVLLNILLPEGVFFINHQLRQPGTQTSIKLGEPGAAIMARASYTYQRHNFVTNVAFSIRALSDNMNHSSQGRRKWLVGEDAKAAILFLHGGGTKSAGAHVAESMINHFKSYKIDVLSLDLPWHGEGPREFLGSFEMEIKVLSAFAKKYVPPHVPLFVWGHSWGSVFAEQLMRMTDRKPEAFLFHQNLRGIMIYSTAVDAAPGGSFQEKYQAFFDRQQKAKTELSDQFAENETRLWQEIVEDGKISPLGSFFSMITILQLDQQLPVHRGREYVPALMVVGKGDPLVYVGYENLYADFYNKMENIETHYLDKLPLYHRPKGHLESVGHLIGDYVDINSGELIHYKLSREFMEKQLNQELRVSGEKTLSSSSFVTVIQHYANDLAFRKFLGEHEHFLERKTSTYAELMRKRVGIVENLRDILIPYGTVTARIYNLLSQLVNIGTPSQFEELKPEIKTLIDHFIGQLNNKKLRDFLIGLDKETSDSVSIADMHVTAKDVINRYFKNVSPTSKGSNTLIRRLFNDRNRENDNLEHASQIIKEMQLPEKVERVVLSQLEEYYVINRMLSGTFVPSLDKLMGNGDLVAPEHREKVTEYVNQLAMYANRKRQLDMEILEITVEISRFQKEYYKSFSEVKHQIRLIKEALQRATLQPPISLEDEYQKSREAFETLEKASNRMVYLLERESALFIEWAKERTDTQLLSNMPEVETMFGKHSEAINQFNKLYFDYIINREVLKKSIIEAIERGEMGSDFQEAVINIYGYASRGERPKLGTNSLYLDLENKTNALAELESQMYAKKKERMDVMTQYQNVSEHLLNRIHPGVNTAEWWPEHAHRVFSFQRMSAPDILNMVKGDLQIRTTDSKEQNSQLEYIKANSDFFDEVMHVWHKQLRSSLPPALPTDYSEF